MELVEYGACEALVFPYCAEASYGLVKSKSVNWKMKGAKTAYLLPSISL